MRKESFSTSPVAASTPGDSPPEISKGFTAAATDGLDPRAYMIALKSYLTREGRLTPEEQKFLAEVFQLAGLPEDGKEIVMEAIEKGDSHFLNSLSKLNDFVSRDQLFIHAAGGTIAAAYSAYRTANEDPPTAQVLYQTALQVRPGIRLDIKTVRDVCRRYNLELSKARKGRPKKCGS